MTKPTKWHVHPAKTQSDQPGHPPSLIRVLAVHSMGSFLHADSEDSDQTGRLVLS